MRGITLGWAIALGILVAVWTTLISDAITAFLGGMP